MYYTASIFASRTFIDYFYDSTSKRQTLREMRLAALAARLTSWYTSGNKLVLFHRGCRWRPRQIHRFSVRCERWHLPRCASIPIFSALFLSIMKLHSCEMFFLLPSSAGVDCRVDKSAKAEGKEQEFACWSRRCFCCPPVRFDVV